MQIAQEEEGGAGKGRALGLQVRSSSDMIGELSIIHSPGEEAENKRGNKDG